MSTPARIAERHDPLFTSCMAHVQDSDHWAAASILEYGVGSLYGGEMVWPTHHWVRKELLALNAAQDRAAMANAGDEGEKAA